MATTTQVYVSTKAQNTILNYVLSAQRQHAQCYNVRSRLEWKDRIYMREVDFSIERWKAEQVKRSGIITKYQNIVIPAVLPQVESAVTFQSEMFLSGYPIFGTVSDPLHIDAAVQMDTIIGDQQIRGGWVLEYQKAFRDGFKYNLLGTLVDWSRERTFSIGSEVGTTSEQLTELIWEGNVIKRLDLYNTFWDASVVPAEVSKNGEYAGFLQLFSKTRLQRWLQATPGVMNVKEALSSGIAPGPLTDTPTGYYFPQLNPEALILPDTLGTTSWVAFWNGEGGTSSRDLYPALYSNRYQVTTIYARIVPAEFGIYKTAAPRVPQIWKFVIVNNKIVVLAERLTNAHDCLPMVFAQAYDDGLGYQTKSLLDNVTPIQEITTALANSSIHSRRRAISDRGLYDPLRVDAREINNESPTAKIPVKPGAFGDDLGKAYHPIPFQDDQFNVTTAEMANYLDLGDNITGMNQARQGQFTKGNRTRAEFASIMAFGSGRDRTISQSLECSLFQPTKEIIKANILQFQQETILFNAERQESVTVDPVELRKAMTVFKLSDGLLPSERIMDGESLTIAMQTIQAVPQLAQGYNIVPMFSYIMKSRGAKLKPFEKSPEQLAYEQALLSWQEAVVQAGQQVAEAIQQAGEGGIDEEVIQAIQRAVPPQPKPADFNYDPARQVQAVDNKTILQQVIEAGRAER